MLAARTAARAAQRASSHTPTTIRAYAQAAAQTSTKPPIALFGIDGTYASALYTAAAKSAVLEPTAKSMETLAQVFKRDPKLHTVLEAPTLSLEDKNKVIAELEKHISADKEGIVKNLLTTLAENNRLGALDAVCANFAQLMSAYRGEVELIVTSAAPLDNRVIRQLENVISKSQYIGQGQKLKVVPKVNPDIRGGLIVEIGDRTIDLSVSAKMSKMNKLLRDQL
ncbi:OSCP-domain-containing protein [Trichodelitschia bisporula]|uniref:ATP synthase subunit 5, mitochondrial n=1 Tax=Trichodelitschia bisporula TaxID=703511 RepID=A0A6G1IA16_9PEZI|nr:OSCP-domain-containing protein [Trichodelitschia bisporula]